MGELAIGSDLETQYVWLRGRKTAKPKKHLLLRSAHELKAYVEGCAKGSLLHFDWEATGLKWWRCPKRFRIVGLGLWHKRAELPAYIRLDRVLYTGTGKDTKINKDAAEWLVRLLTSRKLAAYNMAYDGGVLYGLNKQLPIKKQLREREVLASLVACPLTLVRMLANEGKQSHSLETIQKNLLGWEDSQKDWLKGRLAELNLTKGDMYKIQEASEQDADAFASYCALDAAGTGLIWQQLLEETARIDKTDVVRFHLHEGMSQIRELIEQAWTGIRIDVPRMKAFLISSYKNALALEAQLRAHPAIAHHVAAWEAEKFAETFRMVVGNKYRKIDDGAIVKRALEKAKAEEESMEAAAIETAAQDEEVYKGRTLPTPPFAQEDGNVVEMYNTLRLSGVGEKTPRFNFGSTDHRSWLFYEKLGYAERIVDEYERDVYRYTMHSSLIEGSSTTTFYLPPTKKGNKPTGKEIFPVLGELGDLMKKYKKQQKLYEYAVSYYSAALGDGGYIHPTFNPSGTHTGRLSAGGGINVQQLPKNEEFLSCFLAPEGYSFVDFDFAALEKIVQAEFSKCPNLKKLYASGETHDVHLFNTMSIHPDAEVREKLKAAYRPDKEHLEKLAKEYKPQRTFGKGLGFSLDYGAGVYKCFRSITNAGFAVTYTAVEESVKAYKTLYRKVYEFGWQLQKEWDNTGGVIEDAFGFPISIPEKFRHDCTSRFVQRQGHHILMKINARIAEARVRLDNIERPVIQDLHDERIGMCKTENVERVLQLYQESLDELNAELQPDIPFTISFAQGPTLWEIKK